MIYGRVVVSEGGLVVSAAVGVAESSTGSLIMVQTLSSVYGCRLPPSVSVAGVGPTDD